MGKHEGKTKTLLDTCRDWVNACEAAGHQIYTPAISFYEALRELEMQHATRQIETLKRYCFSGLHFIPLTTENLEHAAQLWGQARRMGRQTADPLSLDGDMILCAQVLSLGLSPADYVVATTNPKHLTLFVNAAEWDEITP